MFAMPGLELPYRNRKGPGLATNVRGFSRRRHGTSSSTMDQQFWLPMMSQELWRRNFAGRHAPSARGFNRFEELDAVPLPRTMRAPKQYSWDSDDYSSSDGQSDRTAEERGKHTCQDAVPFDQAADALCQALQFSIKHCRSIQENFNKEITKSTIASWAQPKVIDALWSMKLDWDGINLSEAEKNPNLKRSPETVTYKDVVKNLSKAYDSLKTCGRPETEYLEEASSKLSPKVFRNTMKKLQCTMSGIEALMGSVRSDRLLVEHLVKDMADAAALLKEVEDLWMPARKQRAAEKARAKWEDEEYVWAEYE